MAGRHKSSAMPGKMTVEEGLLSLETDGWDCFTTDSLIDRFHGDSLTRSKLFNGYVNQSEKYSNSNSAFSISPSEYSSDDITSIYFPDTCSKSGFEKEEEEVNSGFGEQIKFTPTQTQAEKFESGKHRDTSKHEMSQSSDMEGLSAEDIDKLLENFECPHCQSSSTSKVDDLNVRYCQNCHSCFGADDSMDLVDLQRLLEEGKAIIRPTKTCPCGNDDVDKFVIRDICESTGQILVECQLCSRKMELETVVDGWQDNDSGWFSDDQSNRDAVEEEEEEEEEEEVYEKGENFQNFVSRAGSKAPLLTPLTPPPAKQPSHQGHAQFVCRGCDVREYDIFEKRYDVNGRMTSFKCLNCEFINELPVQQFVCTVCQNNSEKQFKLTYDPNGHLISVACKNCLNFLDNPQKSQGCNDSEISPQRRPQIQPARNKVKSLDDVSVGDHVVWRRNYLISHHAIVVAVKSRDGMLTVIHYTGSAKKRDGHYASVREDVIDVDLTRESLYVYDYCGGSYQPAEVVRRARSRLGENQYNPISQNCEHFAYWCKTGVEHSGQVQSFMRRMWKTGGTAVSAGLREGVIGACRGVVEGLPKKQILGVGLHAGLNRVQGVTAGSGVAAAIKGGALVFDVALNLAFEAGLFAYSTYQANRKYKSGLISKSELHREICQAGCESVGGFIGGTAGGILGQLLIPVPFLGTMIGCTLGSLIGRFLGSFAGKKIAEKFLYKNE